MTYLLLQQWREDLSRKGSIAFTVRVHPGARRTQIKSVMEDGTIKIDIAAPPEDGKANAALVEFLAEEFGLAKSNIEIVSGETSRRKVVRVTRLFAVHNRHCPPQ